MARDKKGKFLPGPDSTRHVFSRDECSQGGSQPTCYRLSREDRVKGGRAAWARTMAETRLVMNLPLPTEAVRAAAERLLDEQDIPF